MRFPPLSGLRFKLVVIVLVAAVPSGALIAYSALEQRQHARSDAFDNALDLARGISDTQEGLIDRTHQMLVTLAKIPEVLQCKGVEPSVLLAELMKDYTFYTNLGTTGPDGQVICSALPMKQPTNFADREWFPRVLASRKLTISEYLIGRITGKPSIVLIYPVLTATGHLQGLIFASLGLTWLEQITQNAQLPPDSAVTVIDRKGIILSRYPHPEKWVGQRMPESSLARTILSSQREGTSEVLGFDGVPRLYAFKPLTKNGEIGAYIAVGIPTTIAFAESKRMLLRNLLSLGLVGVFVIVAIWFVGGRLITRPVKLLMEVTKRFSEGDLTYRSKGPYGSNEIAQLAQAFDEMAGSLERRQDALQKSEERFRKVFESSSDCILVLDRDYNYMFANQAAIDHAGTTRDKVIGKNIRDGLGHIPEFMKLWMGRVDQVFETGKPMQVADAMAVGDRLVYSESTLSPIRDSHGHIIAVGVVYRDVTDRKVKDQEIQRRNALLKAINDVLSETLSSKTDKEMANICLAAAEEITGSRFGFICEVNSAGRFDTLAISNPGWDACLIPKTNAVLMLNDLEIRGIRGRVVKEENSVIFNTPPSHPDWIEPPPGHPVISCFLGVPLKREGRTIGMIGLGNKEGGYETADQQDVESLSVAFMEALYRRRQEERLQQQFARMNLLNLISRSVAERQNLESIMRVTLGYLEERLPADFSCVCLFHPIRDTLVVHLLGSRSAETAIKMGLQEAGEIPVAENGLRQCLQGQMIYEPDISQVKGPMIESMARAGLSSLAAAPLITEGKAFGVLLAAQKAKAAFNSVDCEFLVQLSGNIALAAHQAQIFEELQKAYDELRETQQAVLGQERLRAMGQMASGLAHDINNALGPITLYTESLLEAETGLSERGKRYLKTIQTATEDIAGTVGRMRAFYRKREDQLDLLPLHFHALVKEVVELTRPRWQNIPQEKGIVIRIKTQVPENLPPVYGIESDIRDAMTNLIFNAVDAMPQGGAITMKAMVEDSRFLFEITDTGIGMDRETKRRCLEPFFTRKGERGTGLGLAMVYGVMERHDGEIEIESEPGKGTTVRLIFPLRDLPKTLPAAAPETVTEIPPCHILVIDDDPLMRESLYETLVSDHHKVEVADGGQAGLEIFHAARVRAEAFDLVITDLGMPYMDGRQVANLVKRDSPDTPVILLTGWGMRMQAENDIPAHVDLVLGKPPKIRELRKAVADLTKRIALRGEKGS